MDDKFKTNKTQNYMYLKSSKCKLDLYITEEEPYNIHLKKQQFTEKQNKSDKYINK